MRLGVNIDHIATLREARGLAYPDPVEAAFIAESAGADGITVHLRVDRRHIKERDVNILKETVKTYLNVEASLDEGIQNFLCKVQPQWVCIVPENPEERTTSGGINLKTLKDQVKNAVEKLKSNGIKVSLFIEPEIESIQASRDIGADAIELNTGRYADSLNPSNELSKIEEAARAGVNFGLEVHAGHGLNLRNVKPIARIKEIVELNIGHSIISRAVIVGLDKAVIEMKETIKNAE